MYEQPKQDLLKSIELDQQIEIYKITNSDADLGLPFKKKKMGQKDLIKPVKDDKLKRKMYDSEPVLKDYFKSTFDD